MKTRETRHSGVQNGLNLTKNEEIFHLAQVNSESTECRLPVQNDALIASIYLLSLPGKENGEGGISG